MFPSHREIVCKTDISKSRSVSKQLDCDNKGNLIKIHTCFVLFLKLHVCDLFCQLAPGSVKYNNISHRILILSLSSSKTDIDDCTSHPCKNNGTCTDRVNGFNCSCAPGFNGTQCELGNECQNSLSLIF